MSSSSRPHWGAASSTICRRSSCAAIRPGTRIRWLFRSRVRFEASQEASPAQAAESRCAIAAARQGWRARQDHRRQAQAGEGRVAEARARRETGAMTLSRRDLEEGRMRAVYMEAVDPRHPLTDEQLAASLAAALKAKPTGSEWWVFAYGSLLWNPLFPFEDARPATLSGRHRRVCLWSPASRGTSN